MLGLGAIARGLGGQDAVGTPEGLWSHPRSGTKAGFPRGSGIYVKVLNLDLIRWFWNGEEIEMGAPVSSLVNWKKNL